MTDTVQMNRHGTDPFHGKTMRFAFCDEENNPTIESWDCPIAGAMRWVTCLDPYMVRARRGVGVSQAFLNKKEKWDRLPGLLQTECVRPPVARGNRRKPAGPAISFQIPVI